MVIIKDFKLPKNCFDCPCCNGEIGRCNFLNVTIWDYIPKNCPLEEVPDNPHEINVTASIYDLEEVHENCTVQIWKNSNTGKYSIGWYENND